MMNDIDMSTEIRVRQPHNRPWLINRPDGRPLQVVTLAQDRARWKAYGNVKPGYALVHNPQPYETVIGTTVDGVVKVWLDPKTNAYHACISDDDIIALSKKEVVNSLGF